MSYETIGISIAIISFALSIITTAFFIGKWAGTKDYIHKEIARLESQVHGLQTIIDGMRKEIKDDRHMFRGDLQKWQEGLLTDINRRFDNAKIDGEAAAKSLRDEINRRFDNLDCIKGKRQ